MPSEYYGKQQYGFCIWPLGLLLGLKLRLTNVATPSCVLASTVISTQELLTLTFFYSNNQCNLQLYLANYVITLLLVTPGH